MPKGAAPMRTQEKPREKNHKLSLIDLLEISYAQLEEDGQHTHGQVDENRLETMRQIRNAFTPFEKKRHFKWLEV